MTESGATCPPGLTLQQYNNIDHGVCGRPTSSSSAGCNSTIFSTLGLKYYKVCGQFRGYQYKGPDALADFSRGKGIDGVSITYGQNPRTHIWTYIAWWTENLLDEGGCPCNTDYSGGRNVTSSFIGNHYYCESGLDPGKSQTPVLYANDCLWDGMNCDSHETPCCTNSKMPWFYRVLDNMTEDDIELRICTNEGFADEDTPLDIIELYVQWFKLNFEQLIKCLSSCLI